MRIALAIAVGLAAHAPEPGGSTPPDVATDESVESGSDAQIVAQIHEIVGQEAYAFCVAEARYPLTEVEAQWCKLPSLPPPACPGLVDACAAPRGRLIGTAGRMARRSVASRGPERTSSGPSAPREVATILFWAILILGVGFVIYSLVRAMAPGGDWADDPDDPAPSGRAQEAPGFDAEDALSESNVSRLLVRARQAAESQNYAEALSCLRAAALRKLDQDGSIELHRSRTHGDYLRHLSDQAELREPLGDALRAFEHVHFGRRPATRALFEAVSTRLQPLLGPWVGALLLAIGLGAPWGCGGSLANPWSTSPSGVRALIDLAARRDVTVRYRYAGLTSLMEGPEMPPDALVLLRGAQLTSSEWADVLEWVDVGGVLIVANPSAVPDAIGIEPVSRRGDGGYVEIAGALLDAYGEPTLWVPARTCLRLLSAASEPLLFHDDSELYAAHQRWGEGKIVVFADDHLFTNASLATAGVTHNPEFVVQLLFSSGRVIELLDASTGADGAGPVDAVSEGRLRPLVLQALAFAAIFLLWRGVRFGRVRQIRARTRRAFADHVRAMGLQYARANAEDLALQIYADWALTRLRERLTPGERSDVPALAVAVARRTGRPQSEIETLLATAHAAVQLPIGGRVPRPPPALPIMRALTRLIAETGGMR